MSATVKYKGNTIANITTTSSKTLKTSGKYCEGDIIVENVQDGGITPSGTIDITENGTFDVTNYASALVDVEGGSSTLDYIEVEAKLDGDGSILKTSEDGRYIVDLTDIGTDFVAIACNFTEHVNMSNSTSKLCMFMHKKAEISWDELGIDAFCIYPRYRDTYSFINTTYGWSYPTSYGSISDLSFSDYLDGTNNIYIIPSQAGTAVSNPTYVFRFFFE